MKFKINSRVKNIIALSGAKLLHPFFSFFLIRTISNELGIGGQGIYTTVLGFLLIFEVISSFGLRTLLVREVAQDTTQGQRYFYHAIIIAVPISLICIVLMNLSAIGAGYEENIIRGIWILSATLFATSIIDCSEGVLIGYEKIQMISIVQVISNIVRVIISLFLIFSGYSLITLFFVYLCYKFFILLCYGFILLKTWGHFKFEFDKVFLFDLIKTARVFALILVFVTLYWKTDILMLARLKGNEAVGIYDGAYRFFSIIVIVISNFVVSLFPVISQKFKTGIHQFEYVTRKIAKYFLLIAFPGVGLLLLLSRFLILDLFNSQLVDSVNVLYILSLVIIPYGITEIIAHVFIASGNQIIDMRINGIGMVCNIILNFLLIPKYSYNGAAIATFLSINIYLMLQIYFLKQRKEFFTDLFVFRLLGRIVLSLIIFGGLIWLCIYLKLIYLAPIGYIAYMFAVRRFGLFSDEDKELVMSMVRSGSVSI
ncbi:flippase [bacterium]|nr:flippase [bacterium]